jgi:hypothetical protein
LIFVFIGAEGLAGCGLSKSCPRSVDNVHLPAALVPSAGAFLI